MKNLKVGSLYAGIGGICLGFKQAGYDIEWANEVDKNACITYRENFDHKLYEGDIMELDIAKLNAIDVLAGGFPCQPFSVAGYRKGFSDNRGNHFFRMLDFVDELRPRILFFENVKNLVGHDSEDYGNVPHNRERIFIIGFDKNVHSKESELFDFPAKEELTKTVKDIFNKKKVDEKFYYREDRYMYDMLVDDMKRSDTVYQFRRRYVRENKSNVCPTLTANMGTGGHNVPLIKTKYGFRKLTPRECFSFQGFPSDFKLGNIAISHLYKQAGNSVSVPVIHRIANNIKDALNGVDCRREEELELS